MLLTQLQFEYCILTTIGVAHIGDEELIDVFSACFYFEYMTLQMKYFTTFD